MISCKNKSFEEGFSFFCTFPLKTDIFPDPGVIEEIYVVILLSCIHNISNRPLSFDIVAKMRKSSTDQILWAKKLAPKMRDFQHFQIRNKTA